MKVMVKIESGNRMVVKAKKIGGTPFVAHQCVEYSYRDIWTATIPRFGSTLPYSWKTLRTCVADVKAWHAELPAKWQQAFASGSAEQIRRLPKTYKRALRKLCETSVAAHGETSA